MLCSVDMTSSFFIDVSSQISFVVVNGNCIGWQSMSNSMWITSQYPFLSNTFGQLFHIVLSSKLASFQLNTTFSISPHVITGHNSTTVSFSSTQAPEQDSIGKYLIQFTDILYIQYSCNIVTIWFGSFSKSHSI